MPPVILDLEEFLGCKGMGTSTVRKELHGTWKYTLSLDLGKLHIVFMQPSENLGTFHTNLNTINISNSKPPQYQLYHNDRTLSIIMRFFNEFYSDLLWHFKSDELGR